MGSASCVCGKCNLIVSNIISTGICHCTLCRKMSSSAFSINAVVPTESLTLISGELKSCHLPSDTGTDSKLYFCVDCGSASWTESNSMPGLKVLKAGVLDGTDALDNANLRPRAEQFVARRPSWLKEVNGAKQVESMQECVREALLRKLQRTTQ